MRENPQSVNSSVIASTSDGVPTREEWLHRILFSGEVSKVAQHLALAEWRALRTEWIDVGTSIAEVCHV